MNETPDCDGEIHATAYVLSSACSKPRCAESGKTCRFFPDAHGGTDCGSAVRPLRAGEGLNARHRRRRAFSPGAVQNAQSARAQLVPRCSTVRRRGLADDGLNEELPPVASPVHRWCSNELSDDHLSSGEVIGTRTIPSLHAYMMLAVRSRGVCSGCSIRGPFGDCAR